MRQELANLAKEGYATAQWVNHRIRARAETRRLLSILVGEEGCSPLSRAQEEEIREYSRETFGKSWFGEWLRVYTVFRGAFYEGWMPDDFFGEMVLPKVNKAYRGVSNIKTLTRKFLRTDAIPDIAYYIGGAWFDSGFNPISKDEVEDLVFSKSDRVFLKKDDSNQGRGVRVFNRSDWSTNKLSQREDFVVQRGLVQDPWFDQVFANCVATIRITTAFDPSQGRSARKIAAYFRMGRGHASHVTSAGGLWAPIIDNLGELGDFAVDHDWRRYRTHPDTGFTFSGKTIPGFVEAVKVCERLHAQMPHFMFVGWDVIVCDDGSVQIMEWNAGHPTIKYTEATVGPSLGFLDAKRYRSFKS